MQPTPTQNELRIAKRSTFFCTLSKIRPDTQVIVGPGDSIGKASTLRLLYPTAAELPILEQRVATGSQRPLLEALCSPDPLRLIAEFAKPGAEAAGRELASLITTVRTELFAKTHAEIIAWLDATERKLTELEQAAEEARQRAFSEAYEAMQAQRATSDAGVTEGQPKKFPPLFMRQPRVPLRTKARIPTVPESFEERFSRVLRLAKLQGLDITPVETAERVVGAGRITQLPEIISRWEANRERVLMGSLGNGSASPLGYLHLERLDYIPAGMEPGELLYSLPLAPGEEVFIVHKQWSNTEQEFQKLVDDQFENYSEKGVSEKTDLSESASSQRTHTTSFGTSVSGSGSFGFLIASASVSASVQQSAQQSESDTRQSALNTSRAITQTASARSRRENKVSFRLATKSQVQDETTKHIKNPDPFNPVRYDYFQLMRRWRVDHRRYGIRLTNDLTIPDPGGDLASKYLELFALNDQLEKGTSGPIRRSNGELLTASAITRQNWRDLAAEFDATVAPPPPEWVSVQKTQVVDTHVDEVHAWSCWGIDIDVPDGYQFSHFQWAGYGNYGYPPLPWADIFYPLDPQPPQGTILVDGLPLGVPSVTVGWGLDKTAQVSLLNIGSFVGWACFAVRVWFHLDDVTFQQWQSEAFARIKDAAHAAFSEQRSSLSDRRARLLGEIQQESAITLRKTEREELMKGVMRWLFGPTFHFVPPGLPEDPYNEEGLPSSDIKETVREHGALISFLHQAIEWENINYFLYPYHWLHRNQWENRLRIQHDDPIHEAFLRAGAARVVLPIRRGWEAAFLAFANGDNFTQPPAGAPYLTIANEIEAFERQTYPGIQPVNPQDINPQKSTDASEGVLIGSWYEFTPTPAIDIKVGQTGPVEGVFIPTTFNPATQPSGTEVSGKENGHHESCWCRLFRRLFGMSPAQRSVDRGAGG